MSEPRETRPVPGPRAFRARSRDARLTQAAIVLSAGAAVGGRWNRLDEPEAIGLPSDLGRIARPQGVSLPEALAPLGIDVDTYVTAPPARVVSASVGAELVERLAVQPDAATAAALIETNLHSDSRLVRTAAAVAALDTTGAAGRPDLVATLVEGTQARDGLTRQLARIGLARVDPGHPTLAHVVGRAPERPGAGLPARSAVLTHGTFSSRTRWWRPGGDFYSYLDGLAPPLDLHDPSFPWSGLYSDPARQLAARQLTVWLEDQGLAAPDFFAHSHGGTVANLATRAGTQFERLVLLSWPVHPQWLPDLTRVQRIIDVRVRLDLVIIADQGSQTLPVPDADRGKVSSHVNGWFEHGATHDPAYWQRYNLPAVL